MNRHIYFAASALFLLCIYGCAGTTVVQKPVSEPVPPVVEKKNPETGKLMSAVADNGQKTTRAVSEKIEPSDYKIPEVPYQLVPLDLSRPPSNEEIMAAGQLGGQLYPTHFLADKELEKKINLSFGQAIQEWNKHNYKEAVVLFKEHVGKYPDSPWVAEAQLHTGCDAQYTGKYTEADKNFQTILSTYADNQFDGAQKMVNKAQLRMGVLKTFQNNFDEAGKNFTELKARSDNWRDKTYASYWLQTISMMSGEKLALLNCGSLALASLLEQSGKLTEAREVGRILPTTESGQNLADLQSIAARYGYDFVGVSLSPEQLAKAPLPAIVQIPAKSGGDSGHYWILQNHSEGNLQFFDPQAERKFTQSIAEFGKEWGGTALVLKRTNSEREISGKLLAADEMNKIWGGCCGVPRAPSNQGNPNGPTPPVTPPPTNPPQPPTPPAPPPPSCPGAAMLDSEVSGIGYGAPAWSVNMINLNLFMTDTPLWYDPSIGPPVRITLSYNSQSSIVYNQPFGNKWQFNYSSYLVVDTGGQVTIFMQDGRNDIYSPDGSGGYSNPLGVFNTLQKLGANQFALKFPDGTIYEYDIPSGTNSLQPFLVKITDQYGQSLSLGYNQSIRLATITDALGQVSSLTYDANGLVTKVDDPFGRSAQFEYDVNKNLTRITDMGAYSATLSYDADVYLTSLGDARGTTKFYIEPASSSSSGAYPPPGSSMWANYRITVTNPLGGVEEYFFDGYYRKGYYTSPRYYLPYESYSDNNYVSNPNKTKYDYTFVGGIGKISQMTFPDGASESYLYDSASGNRSSVSDPHGHSLAHTFNTQGSITTETDAKGNVTTWTYAANGLDPVSVSDGLGTESLTYDANHNVTSITNRLGKTWTATYNAYGQKATETDPLGVTTEYLYYDAAHISKYRLKEIKRDGKTVAGYTYDSAGRVKTSTDAAGMTRSYSYDNLNRVTSVTYPDGRSETTAYATDVPWVRLSTTDRGSTTTSYFYDPLKRLTEIRNPDRSLIRYSYDADSNRVQLIDANGNATAFEYDPMRRLTKKTYADGSKLTSSYDATGLLINRTNARGIIATSSYDANHNLTGVTYSDSTPGVSFAFDSYDRMTSRTDGVGTYAFTYDAASHLISQDGPWANDTLTFTYDDLGRLSGIQQQGGENIIYSYDSIGRFTTIGIGGRQFTYAFPATAAPNPVSLTRPNGSVTTFQQDQLNRLTEISTKNNSQQVLSANAFTYDSRDLRDSETVTNAPVSPALADSLVTYDYNRLNQLLSSASPNRSFVYDSAGNMTTGFTPEGYQFSADYDGENRLKSLTYTDSSATVHTSNYFYSADGFLARQVVDGVETRFVRSGYIPLQERTSANTVARSFLWNPASPGGVGGLLEVKQEGESYYPFFDGKGNLKGLTDTSQNVAASYSYDPFGALLAQSGALEQPYKFSTKHYDQKSGLSYYGYRFYSPLLGRWMNRDPLGERGGINLYGFVQNNPVNWYDPYGLFKWHGNWGGPGWTAGQEKPEANLSPADFDVPALDARDACYKEHDSCIWKDSCKIKNCDYALASCLRNLSPFTKSFWITSQWYPINVVDESDAFNTFIPVLIHAK